MANFTSSEFSVNSSWRYTSLSQNLQLALLLRLPEFLLDCSFHWPFFAYSPSRQQYVAGPWYTWRGGWEGVGQRKYNTYLIGRAAGWESGRYPSYLAEGEIASLPTWSEGKVRVPLPINQNNSHLRKGHLPSYYLRGRCQNSLAVKNSHKGVKTTKVILQF